MQFTTKEIENRILSGILSKIFKLQDLSITPLLIIINNGWKYNPFRRISKIRKSSTQRQNLSNISNRLRF